MRMMLNKNAVPLTEDEEYPSYYTIPYLIVGVPVPEEGLDGVSAFTFTGKNGENYVATVKVRQELDPLYRSEIWLNAEYIEKERSMADIAEQFGITPAAINQWLVKHNIPTRERGRKNDSGTRKG
tara:strand:- start:24347 stop:24721 length:375 start_codon:yes stop_codon:yes gene_type:complete